MLPYYRKRIKNKKGLEENIKSKINTNINLEEHKRKNKSLKKNDNCKEKASYVNLNNYFIEKIIEKEGKINIEILQPDSNLPTLYKYKNEYKNFFYDKYDKRSKCLGKAKFNKKTNEFIIIFNLIF